MKTKPGMRYIAWICVLLLLLSFCVPLIVYVKVKGEQVSSTPETTQPTMEPDIYPSEWFVTDDPNYTLGPSPDDSTEPTQVTTAPTGPDPGYPETWSIQMSDDDIYLLATAIYLEGGIESQLCQSYIGSVILNRMSTQNKTLSQILYAKGQFSVAGELEYSDPTDLQIATTMELIIHGSALPECVTFFRAGHYHDKYTVNTQYIKPYICIDNTYFSHDIRICGNNH